MRKYIVSFRFEGEEVSPGREGGLFEGTRVSGHEHAIVTESRIRSLMGSGVLSLESG